MWLAGVTMKRSTRALVGMVVIDAGLLLGATWLVNQIGSGLMKTTVPPSEAIGTIGSIFGGAIGFISVLLALVFVLQRRKGNEARQAGVLDLAGGAGCFQPGGLLHDRSTRRRRRGVSRVQCCARLVA